MKGKLQTAVLVLGFMSIMATIGMILALSDIYHEYISPQFSSPLSTIQAIPDFASCQGEWFMVAFSVVIIFTFLITNGVYQFKRLASTAKA